MTALKLAALLAVAVLAIGPASPAVVLDSSKPPDAVQVLDNPGFESGRWPWNVSGSAYVQDTLYHTGDWAMTAVDDAGQWGRLHQRLDLARCEPGPVWIRAAWIHDRPLLPTDPDGLDWSQGWVENAAGLVAELWKRHDYDTVPYAWSDSWYRVEGLFAADICGEHGEGPCQLAVYAQTDDDAGNATVFVFDDIEAWCTPRRYRVLLPVVLGGAP